MVATVEYMQAMQQGGNRGGGQLPTPGGAEMGVPVGGGGAVAGGPAGPSGMGGRPQPAPIPFGAG